MNTRMTRRGFGLAALATAISAPLNETAQGAASAKARSYLDSWRAIFVSRQSATFAGSVVEDLRAAGVPVMRFSQDDRHYFDTHHSAADTLNKIDRGDLSQNVAAWAALLYIVAESGVVLHARNP